MISNPNIAPAGACSPDPDRASTAMPENIARLLAVLRILLEFGRHLAATIELRATRDGFWLFRAMFGTAQLPVIHAYLYRGILRATALESLLLQRAAAGRDLAAAPPATSGTPANADPCDEPFNAQIARLHAERARHDAPVDPDNLATSLQIEAEVRDRSISRTIDDIRRDFGVVAIICTTQFWADITDATSRYGASAAVWPVYGKPVPAPSGQQPANDPHSDQSPRRPSIRHRSRANQATPLATTQASGAPSHSPQPPANPHPAPQNCPALTRLLIFLYCASLLPDAGLHQQHGPGFKHRNRAADSFRARPARGRHRNVSTPRLRPAGPTAATGPPRRMTMQRAV